MVSDEGDCFNFFLSFSLITPIFAFLFAAANTEALAFAAFVFTAFVFAAFVAFSFSERQSSPSHVVLLLL